MDDRSPYGFYRPYFHDNGDFDCYTLSNAGLSLLEVFLGKLISRFWGWFIDDDTMNKEIHYSQVDMNKWRWHNFTPLEISCKGNGLIKIDPYSMDCLQKFRDIVGVPVILNSAYRSEAYNKAVGGAAKSQHLEGKAFDIPIKDGMDRETIHRVARQVGFTGFGDYNSFVHIDTGPSRSWDMRT